MLHLLEKALQTQMYGPFNNIQHRSTVRRDVTDWICCVLFAFLLLRFFSGVVRLYLLFALPRAHLYVNL